MKQEDYVEKASALWSEQAERWMDAATLCQSHAQKFVELWTGQAAETQKESQKFVKAWSDAMAKNHADLWSAWQVNLKDSAGFFSLDLKKEGKA